MAFACLLSEVWSEEMVMRSLSSGLGSEATFLDESKGYVKQNKPRELRTHFFCR